MSGRLMTATMLVALCGCSGSSGDSAPAGPTAEVTPAGMTASVEVPGMT